MNSPLVSFCVPVYNTAKYVIETLDSINNQTYSNIELILSDDGSTDNSIEVIEAWLKNHSSRFANVVFVKNPKNNGVCKVMNQLLENASGEYISITASDDIIMPDKLRIQVDLLQQTSDDVCAVYSDSYMIKEDSSPRYGWFIQKFKDFEDLPSGDIFDELLKSNFIPAMAMLVKRKCYQAVGPFDEELSYEDYDMWLRLSSKYKIIYSDYVSAKYRIRNSSLSFNINWNPSKIKIFTKLIDNYPQVIRHLELIAWEAFYGNDLEVIEKLKPFRTKSKLIDKVVFLSKFKNPKPIGFIFKLHRFYPVAPVHN
ncbi:MAG: glycosyltransferase [Chitinophagaceae bacterium]